MGSNLRVDFYSSWKSCRRLNGRAFEKHNCSQNQPFKKHGFHQPELFDDHLTIESAHLVDEINQRFPRDLPLIVEAGSGLNLSNAWKKRSTTLSVPQFW